MNNNKRFVPDQRFLAFIGILLALTLCCVGVAMFLRAKTDTNMYKFLEWDIFLAWVPLIISTLIRYIFHQKGTLVSLIGLGLMSMVWLFFLPNAAYLFTEILHSFRYFDVEFGSRFWYDIDFWYSLTLTFAVAILGLLLSTISIIQIQGMYIKYVNGWISAMIIGALLFLTSIGVYIGRFNRWNTWDILSRPDRILLDIVNDFSAGQSILVEFVGIVIVVEVFAFLIVSLVPARSSNE